MLEQERNVGIDASPIEEPLFTVSERRGHFDLCSEAEVFLHDDINSGEVILVNDTFLMKKTGMDVGVAVVERSVQGGEIEFGRWYGLRDLKLRKEVSTAAKNGEIAINLPKTEWVADRELRHDIWRREVSREELVEKAKKAAEEIRSKKKS